MNIDKEELLFVYGTLRREFENPVRMNLERYAGFLSPAVMQGKLYEISNYPGAVISGNPNDLVYGEVYIIWNREKLFPILDDYEESSGSFPFPQEYVRKQVTVFTEKEGEATAWTYLYNRDVSEKDHILSGDYVKYKRNFV